MKKITSKRIEEDKKIREALDRLQSQHKVGSEEYLKLHRKYYIENDDIRIYWASQ
jgi:hypothetical protein